MTDDELRERAHALAHRMGICGYDAAASSLGHSGRCDAVFAALVKVRDETMGSVSPRAAALVSEAAQLRQRIVEIDDENGALKAKLVETRQRVADLEREVAHWQKTFNDTFNAAPPPVQQSAPEEPHK